MLGFMNPGVTAHDYPKGGMSTHKKTPAYKLTKKQREDAEEADRERGRPSLYKNIGGPSPKAT